MNQTVEKLTVGSGPELFFQIKQINSDKKERDGGGSERSSNGQYKISPCTEVNSDVTLYLNFSYKESALGC